MTKVTEQYPGGEISTEQLKKQLVKDAEVKQLEESKFPTEIIDLPSKGLVYPKEHPLATGKVEMKYMTAKEEDILTSQNLIQKGVVIDMLLRSLIVGNGEGKRINYDDLILGDKNAIMVAARVLGYGADYPVEMTCPACGNKQKETVNLADLENKEVDYSLFKNENRFDFTLPLSKKVISFKLLSHSDEAKVADMSKRMKKKAHSSQVSYELTSRLKQMIVAVDGDEDTNNINKFVENEFISRDSLAFRKYLDAITPDVDMTYYFECTECGHEDSIQIPLSVEFFWPRV
jgi:transcription elongation factor Elf1